MRQAVAFAVMLVMTLGSIHIGVQAAELCKSTMIHPGALNVTLNKGDTSVVRVTGYKPTQRSKSSASPSMTLHVTAGDSFTVSRTATGATSTTVTLPSNFVGNIVIDPTPTPKPTATPAPLPAAALATAPSSPSVRPGGPDDKLTATMKDERYASFSASPSPAPTSSPNPTDEAQPPTVDYTIKGEHPGDTSLVVAQGADCVAIGVHVRPGISDRFLASAGIGTSMVPKYAITTVTAPAAGMPAGTATRVLKTENSGHDVSIPLLLNYRLSDNAHYNWFGTVGFFTNPGSGGLVYGMSYGKEQFLLTLGMHSNNVTDLAPGLHNNDIVPAGINTSVTRRVTSAFFALTIPTTFVSQLLNPLSGGSSVSSGGSGSSNTSGTSTSSSSSSH